MARRSRLATLRQCASFETCNRPICLHSSDSIKACFQNGIREDSDAALHLCRLAQAVAEKIGDEVGAAKAQLSFGLTKVMESDSVH
jgi:hypothetical protein